VPTPPIKPPPTPSKPPVGVTTKPSVTSVPTKSTIIASTSTKPSVTSAASSRASSAASSAASSHAPSVASSAASSHISSVASAPSVSDIVNVTKFGTLMVYFCQGIDMCSTTEDQVSPFDIRTQRWHKLGNRYTCLRYSVPPRNPSDKMPVECHQFHRTFDSAYQGKLRSKFVNNLRL